MYYQGIFLYKINNYLWLALSIMQTTSPIKLSQLTQGIASTIEDAFREMHFWVIADVSNHSYKAEKGYHNFELVEKDTASSNIIARIAAKAWGNGTRQITAFEEKTGQKFTGNLRVLVLVAIEYHPVFGISANVLDIDSNFTLGLLEQQRNATLQRLITQNEFIQKIDGEYVTANKKLRFRSVIQTVALLSSSISAGAEDFKHTLENNSFGYAFKVDDYFVAVQGDKNAGQFLDKLIEIYNSGIAYDTIVITRGGGAQSDFLIFDNYRIARAVAKFPIPIITGIGHQKNQSITDLMVHTQTKTPTKAAEMIIAHNRNFEQRLQELQKNILIASQQLLASHHKAVADTKQLLLHKTKDIVTCRKESLFSLNILVARHSKSLLTSRSRRILVLSASTITSARIILQNRKNEVIRSSELLKRVHSAFLKSKKSKLDSFNTTIKLMDPTNILKKGYAIIKVDGHIVSNADLIEKGMGIEILLNNAKLSALVDKKIKLNGTDTNL